MTDGPSDEAKVETAPTRMAPPAVLAEPISPASSRRFPHLADYQGHVLLGSPNVQVVLAGVPPRALVAAWRPAILAVFELRQGDWERKRSLGSVDIRNTAGPDYQALAVDLGTDPGQGAAYASYIYAVESQKNLRQLITYRLDAESGRLALVFDDYVEGDNAVKGASRWHLRLRPEGADLVVSKNDLRGGIAGESHLSSYTGADVTGLVAYRPFIAKALDGSASGQTELVPQTAVKEQQPIEGYEFFLTKQGNATLLRRVDDVGECLFGAFRPKTLPRPEARLSWILGCATDAPRNGLSLTSPSKDAGVDKVPQPVFVFASDGRLLQYTALYAGERLDLDLPHSVSLQLADTASGRLLPEAEPFTLALGERKEIELPARRGGVLRLDLGSDKTAAVLTVKRLDAKAGEDGVVRAESVGSAAERLGPGSWLVKAWPVLIDLVSGGYEVELSRGEQGTFCRMRFNARPGTPEVLRCDKSAPGQVGALYADLSFTGGTQEPRAYGAALGVEWLARPLVGEALKATAKNPRDERLLPVLRATDEATGVILQLIPGTAALAQRWSKIKPAMTQDVLPTFARLAREDARGAILELGCPGPGVSLFEYELMAKRLNPDALRLFGCQSEASETDLIALWTRLSVARKEPILLTPASELDHPGALRFPRLALAKAAADQDPMRHLLSSLAAKRASVSAGMRVELLSVTSQAAAKSRGPAPMEATVRVTPAGADLGGAPATFALYSEAGMLKQESFVVPPGGTEMKVGFVWPEGVQWLRAELRGGGPDTPILAMTGFVPTVDLLPKQENAP